MAASGNINCRFSDLLTGFELSEFYPDKLPAEKIYGVTDFCMKDYPHVIRDVPRYVLRKLLLNNFDALHTRIPQGHSGPSQSDKDLSSLFKKKQVRCDPNPHPLDVLVSLFLCFDPICRQDLVQCLWRCRLAIPFMIQPPGETPHLYLWALRALVLSWTYEEESIEKRIVNYPLSTLAFLRFGKVPVSKSILLNRILSQSSKIHETFFNRHSKGSKSTRIVVEGMVEVSWTFNRGDLNAAFDECLMVLNLRGDAANYPVQLRVIEEHAHCILVLCNVETVDGHFKEVVQGFLKKGIAVQLLSCSNEESENNADFVSFCQELKDNYSGLFEVSIIDGEMVIGELVDDICWTIHQFEIAEKRTISTSVKTAVAEGLASQLHVDEYSEPCRSSETAAEKIMFILCSDEVSIEDRKKTFFPLQGTPWMQWADADRAMYGQWTQKDKESRSDFMNLQSEIKHTERKRQYHLLKRHENKIVSQFVEQMNTSDNLYRRFFLRWINLKLGEETHSQLSPMLKQFRLHIQDLQNKVTEDEESCIKEHLKKLEHKMCSVNIGIEHILREMGQAYEAELYFCGQTEYSRNYPQIASSVLMDGYPVEIMDGEIGAVPQKWVVSLLGCLFQRLREKHRRKSLRVLALSVLGIQSSGKSTLLNAMFGFQFPVGAARCTRGVFIQLAPVQAEMREKLLIDYLIAIDTEGLRSPVKSFATGHKFDNEIATFVIGFGDITMINLFGENTSYLQELLPISVTGFLRMNLSGISPKCLLVHQNVDKRSNEKLVQQNQILVSMLDDATEEACEFENVKKKLFRDVIEFNLLEDVYYVPSLLEGEPPMAPVNPGYSVEVNLLKNRILLNNAIQKGNEDALQDRVEQLWSSIKRTNFVFAFKTLLERKGKKKLDDFLNKLSWTFRREIDAVVDNLFQLIRNCSTVEKLEVTEGYAFSELETKCKKVHNNFRERNLRDFFERESDKRLKAILEQYKVRAQTSLSCISDDVYRESKTKMKLFLQDHHKYLSGEIQIVRRIKTYFSDNQRDSWKNNSQDETNAIFEDIWTNISEMFRQSRSMKKVEKDAMGVLFQSFKEHHELIDSLFEEEPFCDSDALVKSGPLRQALSYDALETVSRFKNKEKQATCYSIAQLQEIVYVVSDAKCRFSKTPISVDSEVKTVFEVMRHSLPLILSQDQAYHNLILQEHKTEYYLHYLKLCGEKVTIQQFTTNFLNTVCRSIQDTVRKDLPGIVLDAMKWNSHRQVLKSKESFTTSILLRLVCDSEGCSTPVQQHIEDPMGSMKGWLFHYMTECMEEKNVDQKRVDTFLCLIIDEQLGILKKITQETCRIIKTTQSASLNDWMRAFMECNKGKLGLSELCIDLSEEPVRMDDLLEELQDQIPGIRKQAIQYAQEHLKEVRFEDIVDSLFSSLKGCSETCPFCGEMCSRGHSNHNGHHETNAHRPYGLNAVTESGTKSLVQSTCSEDVLLDTCYFLNKDTNFKKVKFKDYSGVYSDWTLDCYHCDEDLSVCWKWLFMKHKHAVAAAYGLEAPANSPKSWSSITKERVVAMLKSRLNQC